MRNTALILPMLLLTACADQIAGPRPHRDLPSLSDVDQHDIEDIEIVEGPPAAAIYKPTPCAAIIIIVAPVKRRGEALAATR